MLCTASITLPFSEAYCILIRKPRYLVQKPIVSCSETHFIPFSNPLCPEQESHVILFMNPLYPVQEAMLSCSGTHFVLFRKPFCSFQNASLPFSGNSFILFTKPQRGGQVDQQLDQQLNYSRGQNDPERKCKHTSSYWHKSLNQSQLRMHEQS